MPNVSFITCQDTLETMTCSAGKEPVLFEKGSLVPAEVVTLIEVAENGWTIVRP